MSRSAFGLSTISGLPAHILIVHLVVVAVPLSALFLVGALHPRVARRLGMALPITALIALLSVFAAMNAGGWLENHVKSTAALRHHTELGGQLWPFSLAVLVFASAVWWFNRSSSSTPRDDTARDTGTTARIVAIGVFSVAAATLSVVQVVRIGDSGSRAAWHDNFSPVAVDHGRDGG